MPSQKPKKPLATKATKTFSRSQPQSLNNEPTNEEQFWNEVAEKSESLIAHLIEATLPISATPQVFNLESDVDYRVLLKDDLPQNYQDNEEYLEKIASENWTAEDVEYVSQDLTCQYFEIVIKALVERLSNYQGFESTNLGGI